MAKRRTKKQKLKTKNRLVFEVEQAEEKKELEPVKVMEEKDVEQTNLIVKGLMKTVWISVVLLGLLGLAYLRLR